MPRGREAIDPMILGARLLSRMSEVERHRRGAHYTGEAELLRVIAPTITRPLRERIEAASTRRALASIHARLASFKVLDPACGSGNFLHIAYREMKRLERELLQKIEARLGVVASPR